MVVAVLEFALSRRQESRAGGTCCPPSRIITDGEPDCLEVSITGIGRVKADGFAPHYDIMIERRSR